MASKKKAGVGTLPHEIMMEQWRKEGRVSRGELSLKAIKLDHRLQAREKHLDLDHVKELHGYVKDGAVFPPIIVFRIDGKDFVGNGFHRCEVHKKEGRPSITADVVLDATWQEAVEFATCCNFANAALTPNAADKKKACFMLLDNGWKERSLAVLGKHVGASDLAVNRWRSEWCENTGEDLPKEIVDSIGRKRWACRKELGRTAVTTQVKAGGRTRFTARFGRKTIDLDSATKEEAESKLAGMVDARLASISSYSDTCRIASFLSFRGICFENMGAGIGGLSGGRCREFALSYIAEDLASTHKSVASHLLVEAVGRVVLLAEHHGLARKVVLVHEPAKGHETIVDLARRLGIEFMTLEQFVETVKADEGDGKAAV